MRNMVLMTIVVLAGCSRGEVAALKARVDAQDQELQRLRAELGARPAGKDDGRRPTEAKSVDADSQRAAFVNEILRNLDGISRFTGWPVEKILAEDGRLRDPAGLARAIKEKSCKSNPGAKCLEFLVRPNNFGAAAGTAIYFDRIKGDAPAAAGDEGREAQRRAFLAYVLRDAPRVAQLAGWPMDKVLTEEGMVRDPPGLSHALKEKSCRMFPGAKCLYVSRKHEEK